MKHTKALGTLGVVLALCGAGCATTPSQETTSTTPEQTPEVSASVFSGEIMKYMENDGTTLYYPKEWKSKKNPSGSGIVFLTPLTGADDSFQDNVGYSRQDITQFAPMTLEQYTDIITEDTLARLKNAKIVSSESIILGGLPGGVLTYTAEYPDKSDKPLKVRNTYTIKDNMVHILTYTATEDSFDTYLPDAKAIEDSFTFAQ